MQMEKLENDNKIPVQNNHCAKKKLIKIMEIQINLD